MTTEKAEKAVEVVAVGHDCEVVIVEGELVYGSMLEEWD